VWCFRAFWPSLFVQAKETCPINQAGMNIQPHWLTGSEGSKIHLGAKLRKICPSVAGILRFFNFSRWRLLPSWILVIVDFYWHMQLEGSRCISVPNFVKIGQTVFWDITIFDFSKWRPH